MNNRRKAAPKGKLSTAQIIAGAKPLTAEVPVCVRGDLVAKWEQADDALTQALREAGDSLAGTPEEAVPLAEAVAAITAEMQQYTLTFKLTALPPEKYSQLKAEHPPRQDDDGGVHPEDRRYGADISTFFPALLQRCTIEPADMTPQLWEELIGSDGRLASGQILELCLNAYRVNEGRVDVPFSPAASRVLRSFGKK